MAVYVVQTKEMSMVVSVASNQTILIHEDDKMHES